jgi:uncharacterized protein
MKIQLVEHPQKPLLIHGFPGVGMIGPIVTEYIIEHLQARYIGQILYEQTQPIIAIHKGKPIQPIGIYYSEQYNIVVVNITTPLAQAEWFIAHALLELAKQLRAWEIISVEGILDPQSQEPLIYGYGLTEYSSEKLAKQQIQPLSEGIIFGVCAAMLTLAPKDLHASFFFCTTHSQVGDSIAAAKVITQLDTYLGLQIDPAPLLERAEVFEEKLKGILDSTQVAIDEKERKNLSYVG